MTLAKDWQFAKLSGLVFGGKDDDGEVEWIGTKREWAEFRELQAKDDRGEFRRYPWQSIAF